MVRFLEHRIGDTRILRLVQKWLRAGVLEDGIVTVEEIRDRARLGDHSLNAKCNFRFERTILDWQGDIAIDL